MFDEYAHIRDMVILGLSMKINLYRLLMNPINTAEHLKANFMELWLLTNTSLACFY